MLDDETARKYITEHLEKMEEEDRCALFMIHPDFASGAEPCGGEEKACIVEQIGQILSRRFRGPDIVSLVGEEDFLAFVSEDITREKLEETAGGLCEEIRLTCGGASGGVTACVGVYLACGSGIRFERLLGQAEAALYEAKSSGRGGSYLLADRRSGESRRRKTDEATDAISLSTLLEYLDGGVGLVEMGPKLMVIYASQGFYDMIGADRTSLKLPCELKELGVHPDYEEDYERTLRAGVTRSGITDHIHRISSDGKNWTWRHVRAGRIAYPGEKYPVMLVLSTDISDLIRAERELRESNERLRVAFRQTPHVLWEVDVQRETFYIYDVNQLQKKQDSVLEDFPRCFMEKKLIHPDSAADFQAFAGKILRGDRAGSGNFIMRDLASGSYGWVTMSFRMICDEEGRPVKAVGLQSKLAEFSDFGGAFMRRRPLPEKMRPHLLMRMKVNLTRDAVDMIWMDGKDQTAWTWGRKYSQIIEMEKKKFFAKNDADCFSGRYSRENLLRLYEEGELWSAEIYKRADPGGNIGLVKDMVNLARDPGTGDITAYACCSDFQPVRERERLVDETDTDPVSGLYTGRTVKKIADALQERENGKVCALALIRTAGEGLTEQIWRYISIVMSMGLGMDCVTGQYRQGILLAFIPDAGSKFDVKRRIEDVFAYVRIAMADLPAMEGLRLTAGVVTGRTDEMDYDGLLMRVGFLSERGKDAAVDTVFFPTEDEDWAWTSLHREVPDDELLLPEGDEIDRPLTKEEQTVAFQCVTDMLSARSKEASLLDALRNLGRFYDAARAYILQLQADRQTFDMTCEWSAGGKQSIQNVVQGVRLGKVPVLRNSFRERRPAIMHTPAVSLRAGGRQEWNFIAYPMEQDGEVAGFICIEDVKKHEKDAALLGVLSPYIAGEERRFRAMTEHLADAGQDALTRLPNLSSYMDVIYSLDSDSYNSMGVLSLDVPNYSVINSSYGFGYGKKMLVYLADSLQNVFGKSYIFRTWDAEFVVLFPNTIQEVFVGRCTRLRAMIQRRYPRQVRIGYVWSDGIFSARNMVKEAQAIMRSEMVKDPPSDRGEFLEEGMQDTAVAQKTFIPYFQPKVDMRTGEVVGAEALARRIGDDGSIISPARFIGAMEENGTIRDLDLFMLDMVLRQLSRWQQEGYDPLKVSVNMSRVTLFNPAALASVLAIQSRYPEIPAEQIELEITETAGDMETATLSGLVDDFRRCGIGFELDDFGTGWANLSMFSNIRFNTVKLDRSLISNLPSNEISSMLVENITQICKNVGMRCIAEGVETKQQADELIQAGCVYGQGFYFAKPLPADEFEKRYFSGRTNKEDKAI